MTDTPEAPPAALTENTLLAGRVRYTQLQTGYRTGLEPVLLAASIPAEPGCRVVEAGAGAGAGLLCLAARVPGLRGIAVERDAALAALARANLQANGVAGIEAVCADVLHWQADGVFDHAFANPPWHDPRGTPSPIAGRESAKRAAPGLLAAWAGALAARLRPRGTISLILPAAGIAEASAALTAAGCAEMTLIPLWPRAGASARLVIIRGTRLGRGPCVIRPGLVLHEGNSFSAAAQAVLRDMAPLQ